MIGSLLSLAGLASVASAWSKDVWIQSARFNGEGESYCVTAPAEMKHYAKVTVEKCNPWNRSMKKRQTWEWSDNRLQFKVKGTNWCIDTLFGATKSGTTLQLWDCNFSQPQMWHVEGQFIEAQVKRSQVWDWCGGREHRNGGKLCMYPKPSSGYDWRKWNIVPTSKGRDAVGYGRELFEEHPVAIFGAVAAVAAVALLAFVVVIRRKSSYSQVADSDDSELVEA